ncbi:MAG: biopolymer transporter ExbD [Candidatus Gastranaerophilales bacterium]|jgi:biopolymer transport protein ExbD/biopolymer transport protein TolR|nr:biopolymer transporter ExbD [Candidatus Gastranaerophilales bacterium]
MKKRDNFNEINITPLTDIFLVLLIIMMVVAPLLDQQGLNLMVPSNVEQQQNQQESKILKITVTDDNTYHVDDQTIAADSLSDYIRSKSQEFKDGVLIQTQENSTHGAVVKVMDAARNAGVTSVSLDEI